jgi:hypothetical protein
MTNLCEGDRVAAVRFALDEGLRIWPIFGEDGKPTDAWRVVQVVGQSDARLAFTDRDEYRVTARSRALPSTDNR